MPETKQFNLKMRNYLFVFILALISCNKPELNQNLPFEEIVYNDLLDTLYSIDECHFPMIKPENYPYPVSEFYRNKYLKVKQEFDSLIENSVKNIYAFDSLQSFEINNEDKILLFKSLEKQDSIVRTLITNFSDTLFSRELEINLLDQHNTNFRRLSEIENLKEFKYGDTDTSFNIGIISFSRILFNESNNYGICYFKFIGSRDCGYEAYLIIKEINNKWHLIKKDVFVEY